MKTIEEVKAHLEKCMDQILLRPKMWTDTPLGLETQFLYMLHLSLFIDEQPDDEHLIGRWCKWAGRELGVKTGALTVASYLHKENKLDADWKVLTDLLAKFRSEKGWVWSVKKFIEENEHLFTKDKA